MCIMENLKALSQLCVGVFEEFLLDQQFLDSAWKENRRSQRDLRFSLEHSDI